MQQSDTDRIKRLEEQVVELQRQSEGSTVDRLIGTLDKKIIEDAIFDQMVNLVWTKYIYILSFFDSASRFLVAGTTTSGTVTSAGMEVSTAVGTDYVKLLDASNTVILHNRNTRFRVSAKVSATTDVDANISTLFTDGGQIGFDFTNGTIYGSCNNISSESTVNLGTYTADTYYKLEFRYYVNQKVVFYVNGIEKGTVSAYFPSSSSNMCTYIQTISVVGASSRKITAQYYELLQEKL